MVLSPTINMIDMIQIDDTLVSLDVIERHFLCDLAHCKGECCVEGDAGAPLEEEEFHKLREILPEVWNDLSPKAQEVINKQGVGYIDEDGDIVTSIVAYREGRIDFYKPISCHLYPIRITKYPEFQAVNYHRWKVCKAAEILGEKEKLPIYKFLKEPLIRKFGQAWYDALEECADEWNRQKETNG